MSAAGRNIAVSRKHPLVPAHASPVVRSGGAVGGSGSPKAKRRLFAAGPGSCRSTVASAAANAESSSHADPPCSQFKTWALVHKGKVTSDVDYNLEDPPSAYNNATVHSRLSEYTSIARAVHGLEYDPSTEDLDGEVVMRVGGGKKHGRYWIRDSTLNTATTTLSHIRARSMSSNPAIHPRPDTSQHQMEALQAQLEEELREAKAARMEAERQWYETKWQWMEQIFQYLQSLSERMGLPPPPMLFPPPTPRMEAEWQWYETKQRQLMEQMFQYLQSLSERMGLPLPPMLFPPTPPATTPNHSVASNDGPHDPPESPWPAW